MVTKRQSNDHFLDGFWQYEWEKDSAVVPDWMNAAKGSGSYARVAKLIDEICQVEAGMDRSVRENWYNLGGPQTHPKEVLDLREELNRRHHGISETLSRYSYSPAIKRALSTKQWLLSMSSTLAPDDFVFRRVVSEGQSKVYMHAEHIVGEADVVLRILNLAAASELERVKQCERCSKWFYAERSHQRFCPGGECRVAEYSNSPKYKNYRKLYMRRQRAKQATEKSAKLPQRKGT